MNLTKEDKELIRKVKEIVKVKRKTGRNTYIGYVASLLVSKNGNLFSGLNLTCACDVGFCSEQSAIGAMVTKAESVIKTLVTVDYLGNIRPPCGKCRETMYQLNSKNLDTMIIIAKNQKIKLKDLLSYRWQEAVI